MKGRPIPHVLMRFAPLWLLLIAVAGIAIAPIGYIGGGADDTEYLNAARCWIASGHPCLPHSHWATRWPVITPIAAFIGLLGESRLSVGLGPLAAWLACIVLVVALGRTWFDRATGYLAGALLAATPVVTQAALQPMADNVELAFQLAALLAASVAFTRQSVLLAILAGALAAGAVETRDTSLLALGATAIAWLFLDPAKRRILWWALPGFGAVIALDLAVYGAVSGDPLHRFRLALGHGGIPSAELDPGVDTSRSPLFNPNYIAGWRREAGIHWWWPVDPWLNLIASPRIGIGLIGLVLAAANGWRSLSPAWAQRIKLILGGALIVSLGLVYALAVDPKPRMFLALAAAIALALAALTVAAWRHGRGPLAGCIAGLVILSGLVTLSRIPDTRALEARGRQWIAANPQEIEIDPHALTTLTLLPEARALPGPGSGKPLRIQATLKGCDIFRVKVIDQVGDAASGELCLLRLPAK